jgi:hypothetical protein
MSKKQTANGQVNTNANTQSATNSGSQSGVAVGEFTHAYDPMANDKQTPTWNDIATGRRMALSYEPQTGQPIDGGSEQLRNFSPFTLTFVLPDDLQDTFNQLNVNAKQVTILEGEREINEDSLFAIQSAYDNTTGLESLNYVETYLNEAAFQQFSNPDPEVAFVGTIQVVNYVTQLLQLLKTPKLQVLVNPVSMSITYTKVQEFNARTRKNRIFRAWGEEQPTITFSFTTGGFIAGQERHFWSSVENTPSGLQYASKKRSAAWQNFMKIFHIYQNMGLFYDTVFDTEAHLGVGGLRIDYDQMAYYGMIESFDFTYDAESPNRLAFEVSFIVSKILDLSESSNIVLPQRNPHKNEERVGNSFLNLVEGL